MSEEIKNTTGEITQPEPASTTANIEEATSDMIYHLTKNEPGYFSIQILSCLAFLELVIALIGGGYLYNEFDCHGWNCVWDWKKTSLVIIIFQGLVGFPFFNVIASIAENLIIIRKNTMPKR